MSSSQYESSVSWLILSLWWIAVGLMSFTTLMLAGDVSLWWTSLHALGVAAGLFAGISQAKRLWPGENAC